MSTLGRLEPVDLRREWPGEASHFTPWLAQDENIALLGDVLGLELELEAQERAVGPFRADMLCKDIGQDHWVLIENQLERTDHTHLGQVMTYAAGLDAATIVWIAARFTEEHRATLDWLNRITDDSFRFFGLEVQLWRIGNSLSAPRFNVISQPNDWSRSVKRAARQIDDGAVSDLKELYRTYWEGLHEVLISCDGAVSGNRKPQPQSWMTYSLGRAGMSCAAFISRPLNRVSADVYLSGKQSIILYKKLFDQRQQIEQELGFELEWPEMADKQDRRIIVPLPIAAFDDQSDWPRQHQWLAERLNDLHRVFAPRVSRLNSMSNTD